MNAKDKAKELVDKFIPHSANPDGYANYINAKQCALIAVNEILEVLTSATCKLTINLSGHINSYAYNLDMSEHFEYWQEVKQEIEKL